MASSDLKLIFNGTDVEEGSLTTEQTESVILSSV